MLVPRGAAQGSRSRLVRGERLGANFQRSCDVARGTTHAPSQRSSSLQLAVEQVGDGASHGVGPYHRQGDVRGVGDGPVLTSRGGGGKRRIQPLATLNLFSKLGFVGERELLSIGAACAQDDSGHVRARAAAPEI